VLAAGYFGTLSDGVITFPKGGLIGQMGSYGPYLCNEDGLAKIVLPSASSAAKKATKVKKQKKSHPTQLDIADKKADHWILSRAFPKMM